MSSTPGIITIIDERQVADFCPLLFIASTLTDFSLIAGRREKHHRVLSSLCIVLYVLSSTENIVKVLTAPVLSATRRSETFAHSGTNQWSSWLPNAALMYAERSSPRKR